MVFHDIKVVNYDLSKITRLHRIAVNSSIKFCTTLQVMPKFPS